MDIQSEPHQSILLAGNGTCSGQGGSTRQVANCAKLQQHPTPHFVMHVQETGSFQINSICSAQHNCIHFSVTQGSSGNVIRQPRVLDLRILTSA